MIWGTLSDQKNMQTDKDRELINKILQGDEIALKQFYHLYHKPLFAFIKNKINDEKDVEEIQQDTLLATIEALRDFSYKSALFTFICAIAKHKIVDFYRRKKIKSIVYSRIADIDSLLSTLLNPEKELDEAILRKTIRKTFCAISPNYQLILRLKYVYGYSVFEIASKLSISFKSAESRLFRARRAFVEAYSL